MPLVQEVKFGFESAPITRDELNELRSTNHKAMVAWAKRSDHVLLLYLASIYPVTYGIFSISNPTDPGWRILVAAAAVITAILLCIVVELRAGLRSHCKKNAKRAQANKENLQVADLDQVLKLATILKDDVDGKYGQLKHFTCNIFATRKSDEMLEGELKFAFTQKHRIDEAHARNTKLKMLDELKGYISANVAVASNV